MKSQQIDEWNWKCDECGKIHFSFGEAEKCCTDKYEMFAIFQELTEMGELLFSRNAKKLRRRYQPMKTECTCLYAVRSNGKVFVSKCFLCKSAPEMLKCLKAFVGISYSTEDDNYGELSRVLDKADTLISRTEVRE